MLKLMDLFDSIQGRKSIRRFKQTPVPDEDIKKILDAGRRAPSANNIQPWSFIVVKNRTVLQLMADAARQMIDRMIPYAESEKQAQRLAAYKGTYYTFFENAPVVIAVLMEGYDAGTDRVLAKMGYSSEDIKRLRPLPGLQSVAAAIENMLLAIHALGYGSCWMTGPLVAQEAFEKLLGFGKEKSIAALLPVGVPDENPPARPRKPLEEIVRVIG
ncbi:MAG TPA: nitroreductase family protein [Nitrospirota bacterium]|nr:nitroreductase family protein [Nitrospirota bacterium]